MGEKGRTERVKREGQEGEKGRAGRVRRRVQEELDKGRRKW
jgi:hypothetical protein